MFAFEAAKAQEAGKQKERRVPGGGSNKYLELDITGIIRNISPEFFAEKFSWKDESIEETMLPSRQLAVDTMAEIGQRNDAGGEYIQDGDNNSCG